MISAVHLMWMLPLTGAVAFVVASVLAAGKDN